MAVVPTGAIYKSLYFDGEDSRDYGVYITGQAVYNAPEREVEMVAIPGRNGALALDRGRFENIEVTYPAGIFADNEADFAEAISNFRNSLCSRRGYVRLQDEYNPNEYRMAIYKSGLEVEPATLRAGEFEIIFDCKPQRYLTSGEEPITIGEWRDTETVSGDIVEVENPDGDLGVKSLSVTLEPIQSGSGTPSPDNVRPISGQTECDTYVGGVNVWDEEWEVGGINANGEPIVGTTAIRSKNFIKVEPNAKYYFHTGANGRNNPFFYDENKNFVIRYGSYVTNSQITIPSDCHYMKFGMTSAYGTTYNHDISVNYPSTDTSYHAYNGQTYTTPLGRTVYGGTLDVVSGELKVTHGFVDIGTLAWRVDSTSGGGAPRMVGTLSDAKASLTGAELPNIYCDSYPTVTPNQTYNRVTGISNNIGGGVLVVFDPNYTDATAFKASVNGVMCCYELATPQTYQLSETQINLLSGQNNVWSDGGSITLEYGMLPNLVINPTLFESSPLLEVDGYGTMEFNGYQISLSGEDLGTITTNNRINYGGSRENADSSVLVDFQYANPGDSIFVDVGLSFEVRCNPYTFSNVNVTKSGSLPTLSYLVEGGALPIYLGNKLYGEPSYEFHYGTASSYSGTVTATGTANGTSFTAQAAITISYDGADTIRIQANCTSSLGIVTAKADVSTDGPVTYYSTQSTLGNPLYIDCEIGEAYKIEGGTPVSINSGITLGSDLPKLSSGANTFTFDNTIAELKVIPRWWKI